MSVALHISRTIYHIILIYCTNLKNDNIFRCFFPFFQNSDFPGCWWVKMAKNDQKSTKHWMKQRLEWNLYIFLTKQNELKWFLANQMTGLRDWQCFRKEMLHQLILVLQSTCQKKNWDSYSSLGIQIFLDMFELVFNCMIELKRSRYSPGCSKQ